MEEQARYRKVGRPALKDEFKRSVQLNLNLTKSEDQRIRQMAKSYDIPVKDYIIQSALSPKKLEKLEIRRDENFAQFNRAFQGMANNFNQITRRLNAEGAAPEILADLHRLMADIDSIRKGYHDREI